MTSNLTVAQVRSFRQTVRRFFARYGRDLPWRHTRDPYCILVSEIMLQQTQVDRVAVKFPRFIAAFPDLAALADAPVKDVLAAWSGLGYNRRGLMIQRCARQILAEHGGRIPAEPRQLQELPGIGPATARSIAAFAFNKPVAFIETNIRAVFIHHFFAEREKVDDAELLPLVERTLDRREPAVWYSALMDYGTQLKREHRNPARRSSHHVVQSSFEGSDRKIRGELLRRLLKAGRSDVAALRRGMACEAARLERILCQLQAEGFIRLEQGDYSIC